MERMIVRRSRAVYVLKAVLLSYVVTLFLLLTISFLMLKTGMSAGGASIAIIAVYVIASFVGGYYLGKHVEEKRYVWGLVVALVYFMFYILISLLVKGDTPTVFMDYINTLLIISLGGMLGGMLS